MCWVISACIRPEKETKEKMKGGMQDKVLRGEQEHGAGMRLMLPQRKCKEELINAC